MALDLQQMTFGIEIECTIPSDALRREGWTIGAYHVGALIPGHDGWKTMHDGSIRASYPRSGVEVVSPVLRGAEGLASVRAMVAKLNAMGATVNQSTGFHVHVGFTGDAAALRRLICFTAFHEKALFASTGTRSREGNNFCASIRSQYRALEGMRTTADVARHAHSRYHVLNLQNLSRPAGRQTVEFRVFAGTTNITKIEAYIGLCLGMVQKASDRSATLPWDAPASKRQARENIGAGALAMRRLINHLGWFAKGKRYAFGVIDREQLPTYYAKLRELADKYDGPRPVVAPAAVAPAPAQ